MFIVRPQQPISSSFPGCVHGHFHLSMGLKVTLGSLLILAFHQCPAHSFNNRCDIDLKKIERAMCVWGGGAGNIFFHLQHLQITWWNYTLLAILSCTLWSVSWKSVYVNISFCSSKLHGEFRRKSHHCIPTYNGI